MEMSVKPVSVVRDLGPALLVSLGVALVFTAAAAVFQQFHQVAAEDLNVHQVPAVAGPNSTQVMNIKSWGVTLTLPLGSDMPLVSYAGQGPDSVGLTTASLSQYGTACSASRNGVGAIVREPAGSNAGHVMATIGAYDYVYQQPLSSCMDVREAAYVAAQEAMAIQGVGTLAASE